MSRFNPPTLSLLTNAIRLVVQCKQQGQIVENAFDYVSTTLVSLTPSALIAFATDWQSLNQAAFLGCISNQQTLVQYLVQDLAPSTTPTQFLGVGVVGTVAASTLPIFNAAVLGKTTIFKGQHGRGRFYMGAIPTTFTTPGTSPDLLNATALTAYAALRATLLLTLAAGGTTWNLSLLTRPIAPAVIPSKYATVVATYTDTLIGTVRRRIEGRGI